jgi:hypothetical protein
MRKCANVYLYTVIRVISISVKFGFCTVVDLHSTYGTLVEAKIRIWDTGCAYVRPLRNEEIFL